MLRQVTLIHGMSAVYSTYQSGGEDGVKGPEKTGFHFCTS